MTPVPNNQSPPSAPDPVDEHLSSGMASTVSTPPDGGAKLDIEHALVDDDPRTWSTSRKNVILFVILAASVIAGLCNSIQNPANSEIEQELHTTASGISLSLSLFILVQGSFPLIWSTISEIKGRKLVYLLSIVLFIVGSAIVAVSKTIGLVIGMRMVQAVGSSAVIAIGAATLADIYEPHQRGTMMGVFYAALLLGPSIGPILGGGLTQGFSWRAVFWFLVIWGGVIFLAFLFLFKDTFRKERSSMYQNIVKKRAQEQEAAEKKTAEDGASRKRTRKGDLESQPVATPALSLKEVKLSIADVNPFPPYLRALSRRNNVCILIPSALIFAFSYSLMYTSARTLSLHYGYDAMTIGLVLLSYGIGCLLGSVSGGWWSDRTFARLEAANGGVCFPEMRLESTKLAMWLFPPSIIGYAWVCQEHVHVSAICVMLLLSGFFLTWIYASTLTYIVDANVGRSSSAVAANSSFRGFAGFVAAEIAVPLQDTIGDGGLYTLWAGLILLAELTMLLVLWKGKQWREASEHKEADTLFRLGGGV